MKDIKKIIKKHWLGREMKTKDYTIINYQKSNLTFKKCDDCKQETCNLLYDGHHDEHFSITCGTVIMQSNNYTLDYYTDPYYWEKEYSRRRELKERQKIISKLKELRKKTIIKDNGDIQILNPTPLDIDDLTYLCDKTEFYTLTEIKKHPQDNPTYIITRKEKENNKQEAKKKWKTKK